MIAEKPGIAIASSKPAITSVAINSTSVKPRRRAGPGALQKLEYGLTRINRNANNTAEKQRWRTSQLRTPGASAAQKCDGNRGAHSGQGFPARQPGSHRRPRKKLSKKKRHAKACRQRIRREGGLHAGSQAESQNFPA